MNEMLPARARSNAEAGPARFTADEFRRTMPVAEVAVSTRDRDLGSKCRLYAAAGIPTYWVIDAERELIHVFNRPERGEYLGSSSTRFGEPPSLPGTAAKTTLA